MCLPVSMYGSGSITWADPQRERLPVHVYSPVARMDQWHPAESYLVVGFIHPTKHHLTAFHLHVKREERGDPWRTVITALSESCDGPLIKALIKVPVYRCRNRG